MGIVACENCEKQFEFNMVENPIDYLVICLSCDPSRGKDPNWCGICVKYFNCEHTRKDLVKS